jgi:hypothetical protein
LPVPEFVSWCSLVSAPAKTFSRNQDPELKRSTTAQGEDPTHTLSPVRRAGAYANAALFIALARQLVDKKVISKEELSGIVDEAGALLSQGNPAAMRQALQLLPWFRKDLGIEDATKTKKGLGGVAGQEPEHDLRPEDGRHLPR